MGFATTRHRFNPASAASYDASQISSFYNFPQPTGKLPPVAVLELGGDFYDSDNRAYCDHLGIPLPTIKALPVVGGSMQPDPQGADGEVALDVQVILGSTAGLADIDVFFAPNTSSGFSDGIAEVAAYAAVRKYAALSISWGSPEDRSDDLTLQTMEVALAACQAAGVAVFAASGDDGSRDGELGNNCDYPASSPRVCGCGGTTIIQSVPLVESAWSYGGGGFSKKFPKPSWQNIAPRVLQAHATQGRGVPDIAGDANPSSGYYTIINGKPSVIGGTSAVSPLMAGLLSLICGATGNRYPNFNELVYGINHGSFQDITTGSNGAYKAGIGWDAATGFGTVNGMRLLAALSGTAPPLPTPIPTPPQPTPEPTPVPPPDQTCSELLDLLVAVLGKVSQKAKRKGL